ncbi:MAG: transcription termination/antitermination protein NusA [Deltaproteobacteria bacterium]|nr:transcription termination/antitermination protein NusA [Deltaproteobacteria bacterium]
MEQANLNVVLDQVGKDKGIDKSILVETLEQAILSAAKRTFGQHREMEARYNEQTGSVDLFLILEVIPPNEEPELDRQIALTLAEEHGLDAAVGDELLFQIFYRPEDRDEARAQDEKFGELLDLKTFRKSFGRIAAQTAKQVIIQRVREAERENIYNEYKDRQGELIMGIVRRFERGNIIVDLGRAEAILPIKEQVPRETYRAGDRIVAYVLDIDRASRGPQIILSRSHKGLLEKLFETEVPEIYEGIVRIESSAREPGARSKIAVSSRDRDVDPVGACVGMRGSRVQSVVQELHGEKIDIVPYEEDPARFVCNAIAPAEVLRVLIDAENHTMELVVPDDKLSLAIGKKGQNVRLASQLTGWRIDIHSESKVQEMEERAKKSMATIEGITPDMAETMFRLGWRSAEEIAAANPEELANVPGLGGLEAAKQIALAAQAALERAEQERLQRREESFEEILSIPGMDEAVARAFLDTKYETVEDIDAATDLDRLARQSGIDLTTLRQVKHQVSMYVAQKRILEESQMLDMGSDGFAEDEDTDDTDDEMQSDAEDETAEQESGTSTVEKSDGEDASQGDDTVADE